MLLNGHMALGYIRNFRVVHISGRYGGGKTSLAYRIAYELVMKYKFRYILSNVPSVWRDNPADVVLRDGNYMDAVLILDEGGLFLKNSSDTEALLAFMRKLNIVLIVPSVTDPAARLTFLQIERTLNLRSWGLPAWIYTMRWRGRFQQTKDWFAWVNPHEIYGVYDTVDFAADDGGLTDWTVQLMNEAIEDAKRREAEKSAKIEAIKTERRKQVASAKRARFAGGAADVDSIGGVVASVEEVAAALERSVSVFEQQSNRRRGR